MKKISQIICALTLSTAAMSMEQENQDQHSPLPMDLILEVTKSDIRTVLNLSMTNTTWHQKFLESFDPIFKQLAIQDFSSFETVLETLEKDTTHTWIEKYKHLYLNAPATFRISYFCPKMDERPYGYGVSSIVVRLPDNQSLTTGHWIPSEDPKGTRYTLTLEGDDVSTLSISKNNCPIKMDVYLMTGYIDEGQLETFQAIPLCIQKKNICQQLEAIRITHPSNDLTGMCLEYRYKSSK